MAETNKLMVVAHPDDELFFGGDELIQEEGWKVVCVTDGDNEERRQEFERAMQLVGAEYEMWNYKDAWTEHVNRPKLEEDLSRVVNERDYKKIVTHNLYGEYGHPEHKAVAEIMHKIVKENLYMFDFNVKELLQVDILKRKLELLDVYKSQKPAIEQLLSLIAIARTVKVN
ncbi:PIG-L family deacetylase [Fictibacillus terranigra]|uniref:PIG-L family deacetylase n=1 Tax=Fictibacillus terranigra TaxID=3058424 RepID=A0ABT8E844_9BACL|nr:PIG-L family deacetylase [Fictibacillus sp. CENA-BCM004]MDN4074071.1 PIG-L family deacetylase [Fictibacillus sp. CENA-BCM004]